MQISFDKSALAISFCGLLLSLGFSYFILPRIFEDFNLNLDADGNGALAHNIFLGNGMKYHDEDPIALDRGPVYPYLVAAVFFLAGGYSLEALQFVQGLMHAATAYILYLIVLKIYDRPAALAVQAIFVVHPIMLWYTGRIWIETTHAFVLTIATLALVHLYDQPKISRSIGAGLAIGFCCLTKSILLLFPFALLVLLYKRHRTFGLKHSLVVAAVCYLVVVPWTYRNYQVAHAFVPVHTSLGFNLHQGDVIGEHWPEQLCCNLDFWRMGQARVDSILMPKGIQTFRGVAGDRLLTNVALHRYLNDPGFFAYRAAANFFTFWSLSESPLKSFAFGVLQCLLIGLAIVAYVRVGRRTLLLAPAVLLAVYYILMHVLIVGWARYSMPVIPFLLLIASPLLQTILSKRHETGS